MKQLLIILFILISVCAYSQRNTLGSFTYTNGYFGIKVTDTLGKELGHIYYDANDYRLNQINSKIVIDWFSTYFFKKYWETSGLATNMIMSNMDSVGRVIDTAQMRISKQAFDSLSNYWENK